MPEWPPLDGADEAGEWASGDDWRGDMPLSDDQAHAPDWLSGDGEPPWHNMDERMDDAWAMPAPAVPSPAAEAAGEPLASNAPDAPWNTAHAAQPSPAPVVPVATAANGTPAPAATAAPAPASAPASAPAQPAVRMGDAHHSAPMPVLDAAGEGVQALPEADQALALPPANRHHPDALAHLRLHLRAWSEAEQLRALDLALADFLIELEPSMPPLTLLAAVLGSHQLGRGHVCLDLQACLRDGARTLGWRRVPVAQPEPLTESRQAPVSEPGIEAVTGQMAVHQSGGLAILASGIAPNAWATVPDVAIDPGSAPTDSDADRGTVDVDVPAPVAELPTPMDWLAGTPLAEWQAELARSTQVMAGAGASPLVVQGSRLYLRRQWQDEQTVRAAIAARVASAQALRQSWPTSRWQAALQALFDAPGAAPSPEMDWQKAACALAASQGFCIVTGGPGTGKTTTVVKLLALLQAMALSPQGPDAPAHAGVGAGFGAHALDDAASQTPAQALRIALAAPTGKAAARLGESIAKALTQLDLAQLAHTVGVTAPVQSGLDGAAADASTRLHGHIPTDAQTLHRLLGPRADSRHFWHNAHNPLPIDVLVVDEASMVDLDMMARLMQALPAHARLILLGDKDQLASVEAGAVLGELCSRAQDGHFNPATVAWLEAVTGQTVPAALRDAQGTPLDQAVVMLRHSHRFGAESGIGQLAAAVNAGDVRRVQALRQQRLPDLQWLAVANTQAQAFSHLVTDGLKEGAGQRPHGDASPNGYRHYLQVMHAGAPARAQTQEVGTAADALDAALDAWAHAVLEAQRSFQLLCALREGPWGVAGLNRRIARILAGAGLIAPTGSWWAGRPVMVTGNDYGLGLMNGDIGVTLARPDRLAVAFADPKRPGGVRWVAPSRLNHVETVFAMTVHKSQGSEFAHTAVAIPPQWNPVLTRELVYTGITRASKWCSLILAGANGDNVLEMAVKRRVLRASGLLAD